MKVFWLFVAFLLVCPLVWGQVLTVPAEYGSIQSAINEANDGDIVIVSDGNYVENINFLGKAIAVRSTDPNDPNTVSRTIIDGSNPADANYASAVTFNSGEDNNSVLSGFTITGGTGSWLVISWEYKGLRWNRCGGGAVCYNMSAPTISNNVFVGNTAGEGGGIYIYGDPVNSNDPSDPAVHIEPIITNNTFINNSAVEEHGFEPPDTNYPTQNHGDGGAIVGFQGCDITITGNLISNNHADFYGGGIHLRQWSDGLIEDNYINDNNSVLGAGIHLTYISSPIVRENTVRANIAGEGGGGGIYLMKSHPLIEQNLITQNESTNGAGVYITSSSEPVIRNNLIIDNVNGEGIKIKGSSVPTIINNTIAGNTASPSSGSVDIQSRSAPIIVNNIIVSDSNSYGISAIDGNYPPIIKYNNVCGNGAGNYNSIIGDQTGINGNISVEPLFVDQQNNDYHLKSNGWRWDMTRELWYYDDDTSRCIDAGNPGYSLADELVTAPNDPNGQWSQQNLRINMGAYGGTTEASLPPHQWALLSDLTNDGIVHFADIAVFVELWLETGADNPADFNRDNDINLIDYSLFAIDWLMQTSWH